MSTISTEEIAAVKAAHAALAERIAKLEASAVEPAFFAYQGKRIPLAAGESYVGTITTPGQYGSYHLVLLPGQVDGKNLADAMTWAESICGELPNRVESALLFATLKDQFDAAWYWTREEHASDSGCAWIQTFNDGYQSYSHEATKFRARAVRRLEIQ